MIVERYGIKLIRLKQEHIELLRLWRNAEKINRYMEYRQQITTEMQQRWFDSLDPLTDFYFMIEYHGDLVGMIHTGKVNWDTLTGDAGLFVYKDELLSTHLPVLASLTMVDLFFGLFRLETITAKVMSGNEVAVRYNRNLGFELMPGEPPADFQHYHLKKERYYSVTENLHNTARRIGGEHVAVKFSRDFYDLLESNNCLLTDPHPDFAEVLRVEV